MNRYKNRGFTLVEVLICVGIIGIIATITIPAILSSTSEKALETQRKALHSRMAQAFTQIKNLQAYGRETSSGTDNNSAIELLTNGLSKTYKITSICSSDMLDQCGIPDVIYDYYSETENAHEFNLANADMLSKLNSNIDVAAWGGLDTSVAGFKTANGESILLYYNPKCKSKKETTHNLAYSVCVNMIYDLNGRTQAPNSIGEDIGYITVMYPTDPEVVMPVLYNKQSYSGTFEDMLVMASNNDMLPPTIEELTSILINQQLTKITSDAGAAGLSWSASYGSTGASETGWVASVNDGVKTEAIKSGAASHRYYLLKK